MDAAPSHGCAIIENDDSQERETTLIIEVRFRTPGGRDLAGYVQERMELAALGVLANLSDNARAGVSVTSEIEEER